MTRSSTGLRRALGRIRRRLAHRDAEGGQILLLGIAYGLLALVLVLVVASASAVHIERKQLLALADAAALDASDALDPVLFYSAAGSGGSGAAEGDPRPEAGPVPTRIPLTDAGVREAVAAHLAGSPAARGLAELRVGSPTGTPDGSTAQVTLTALARPPFVPWVLVPWSDGVAVRVTTTALAS